MAQLRQKNGSSSDEVIIDNLKAENDSLKEKIQMLEEQFGGDKEPTDNEDLKVLMVE
jgi:hypothetical protein